MSFQISILKILAGQPEGRASLAVLKDYLAVFYTSGRDWSDRMKHLAAQAPDLNIFGQGLVTRESGQWTITDKGRALLALLEQKDTAASRERALEGTAEKPLASKLPALASGRQGQGASRRHRRRKRLRACDGRST